MEGKAQGENRKTKRLRRHLPLFPLLFPLGFMLAQPVPAATPEENYTRLCAVCHQPGANGAPKVGDEAEWTQRLRRGKSMVYRDALEGVPFTAMTAKAGHKELSDADVKAIVDYMIRATALPPAALEAAARYDRLGVTDRDFLRHDANFDGFLSQDELANDPVLLHDLARFDRDRDGRLDQGEYLAAETALARERAAVDVDDPALASAVREALSKVKGLSLEHTRIEIKAGVVAIIGIVDTPEIAFRAHDAVKRIAGVKRIDNRLISAHQLAFD